MGRAIITEPSAVAPDARVTHIPRGLSRPIALSQVDPDIRRYGARFCKTRLSFLAVMSPHGGPQ
jgi:hypothetical protein